MAITGAGGRRTGHLPPGHRALCQQTVHRRLLAHHLRKGYRQGPVFFPVGASPIHTGTDVPAHGRADQNQVREIAAARGFLKAATKRDSLGVCFCPMDYRSFLKAHVPEGEIIPGNFYDEQGHYLGKHEGYPFYTIGQRRGLGIHLNKALFVKEIIPQENKVIISDNLQALEKNEMFLTHWNLVNAETVLGHDDVIVKIRYRKQANRCTVTQLNDGRLHIQLHEPLASIASGQAAAFYRGDVVLGGGIIE